LGVVGVGAHARKWVEFFCYFLFTTSGTYRCLKATIFLLLLAAIALLRPPEYDEAYSLFLTAGNPRPAWPAGVFHPGDVRGFYDGHAGWWAIAANLRSGDVHPPLYFWALEAWRRVVGPGWFAARALSVLLTVAGLTLLARLAALARAPVLPTLTITLLSYGFAATGIEARGFALAQCLNIAGVLLALAAVQRSAFGLALLAGGVFGAASFSNYLAVFVGVAAMAWMLATRPRLLPGMIAGIAPFMAADYYFFTGQLHARVGQFVAFAPLPALGRLARDAGAAVFGGLPLYAAGFGGAVAAGLLGLFLACTAGAIRRPPLYAALFALAGVAPPAGLIALGILFHNTPIEIRYLAFSLPYLALLFAALPRALLCPLLAVQAAAIAGLMFAPATMQPQGLAAAEAARVPGALILVPFGNDGVGIPGPFIARLPDAARVELLRAETLANLSHEPRIVLATLQLDNASRATITAARAAIGRNACLAVVQSDALITTLSNRCAHQQP
jgi:hypothetical protein